MNFNKNEIKSEIINLVNIRKIFSIESKPVEALHDINLKITRGDIIALTGKSGAGKSTLLHIIGTMDKPTSGKLWLNGIDTSKLNDYDVSKLRNEKIGLIFQMKNLLPEFTALENVMLPGLIAGHHKKDVKYQANKLLKDVNLTSRAKHRPGELSGGEQQRVAIARALLMKPPIVLADEPTGNLDQKTSIAIQELLMKLCEDYKVTMLLVTHDLDLAKRLPKQIIMKDGMIVNRGNFELN